MKWIPDQEPFDFPEFFSRTFDLTNPEPAIETFVLGRENNDYVIENIFAQYPEIGPAPSALVYPSMKLTELCFNTVYLNNINLVGFTTPNNFFPGVSGFKGNQQNKSGLNLDFFIPAQNAFSIELRNYSGAGNPTTLDLVIKGRRLRPGFWTHQNTI